MHGLLIMPGAKMDGEQPLGADSSTEGVVGDPGPEGDLGSPGDPGPVEQPVGIVLMPPEYDSDNLKAWIEQEFKERETELMWKVSKVLGDTLVGERTRTRQQVAEAIESLSATYRQRLEATEEASDRQAKIITDLAVRLIELEATTAEKAAENQELRARLHAATISKPVRKIRKVNSVINGEHGTSKAGNSP